MRVGLAADERGLKTRINADQYKCSISHGWGTDEHRQDLSAWSCHLCSSVPHLWLVLFYFLSDPR